MIKGKKIFSVFVFILIIAVLLVIAINFYVLHFSKENYYKNIKDLGENYVGLVFGASVKNDAPSDILKDRLQVAYEAYKNGKIKKILVSGDNSKSYYNEPEAMKNYLVGLGVKTEDIYLDYAGFDTYDSLYRAKDIFLVNEVVLFTQDFHLKRAMYISKKLGIKTFGVETNLQKYLKENYNNFREIFARIKAFLEVDILKSKPRYLGDTIEIITDEQINKVKNEILNF